MTSGTLWRVGLEVPDALMPSVLDALEHEGQSVSAFEAEAEAADGLAVERWRVEVLYPEPFDEPAALARVRERCAAVGCPATAISVTRVPPDEWLDAAALVYPPILAGRFVIHPTSARDDELPDGVRVRIDAGLAFGSGAHPTTQGCLMLLDEMLRRTRRLRRLLDLGCGTGVLGIAAAKVVPARVLLADNDPVAVRIARENAALNGVAGRARAVLSEGLASPVLRRRGAFDLVLANILADPLCAMARDVSRALAPGGAAILSGLIEPQAARVAAAFHAAGLPLRRRLTLGPWTTLLVAR